MYKNTKFLAAYVFMVVHYAFVNVFYIFTATKLPTGLLP